MGNMKGSGCIINSLSSKYDYLLTAKHLVDLIDPSEIQVIGEWLNEQHQLEVKNVELEEAVLYSHNNKDVDAVIIKIKKGYVSDEVQIKECQENSKLVLCGFPNTRRAEDDSFKVFDVTVKNRKLHGYFEGQVEGPIAPIWDDVVGFSGGGLYSQHENGAILMAIQSQMSAEEEDQIHGRVDIIPIQLYQQIISAHELEPILPDYLRCFSNCKDGIFKLEQCWTPENIKHAKATLKGLTSKIIDLGICPHDILEKFNIRLLVKGISSQELNNKILWESWLEFLIINYVFSKNKADIDEIFNNRRLLFSSAEKPWNFFIQDILESDFKGLAKKGSVVVSTPQKPDETILTGEIIKNISRFTEIDDDKLLIDEGIENPLIDYKIVHLYAFSKECILSKHQEYAEFTGLNKKEIIDKLNLEYAKIFENKS